MNSPWPSTQRIAIVGVGAIGGAVAAHLLAAKRHEILLCTRRPLSRLRLHRVSGSALDHTVRAFQEPQSMASVDWILLATKAYDVAGAAPWLQALGGPRTGIAILQNGVEQAERVAASAPEQSLLPVVVDAPTERMEDGSLRALKVPQLIVPLTEAGKGFRGLFEGAGLPVDCHAHFERSLWEKLCHNIVGGGLTAATGCPMRIFREPGVMDWAARLLDEVQQVALAHGVVLPTETKAAVLAACQGAEPEKGTFMLADRLSGRPMEWDARNGAVVRIGKRYGVATPWNAA